MSTDVNLLGKALIRLAILIFLFIISPISLTIAFKAIKLYPEGLAHWFAILFLIFVGVLSMFTMFFTFITFSKVYKAILN